LAEEGISACERAVALGSNCAPAHYYMAMNMGQLARTRGLGALKLIRSIQREFDAARQLDEKMDFAGPDRSLGLLYRDAPTLGSVGSRTHAREHLQRALELAPEFPENGLNLIETCQKWGDRNMARKALKTLEEHWTEAHNRLTGSAWTT